MILHTSWIDLGFERKEASDYGKTLCCMGFEPVTWAWSSLGPWNCINRRPVKHALFHLFSIVFAGLVASTELSVIMFRIINDNLDTCLNSVLVTSLSFHPLIYPNPTWPFFEAEHPAGCHGFQHPVVPCPACLARRVRRGWVAGAQHVTGSIGAMG